MLRMLWKFAVAAEREAHWHCDTPSMASHLVPDALKAMDEEAFVTHLTALAVAAEPEEWGRSCKVVVRESPVADKSKILAGADLLPGALPTCSLVPEYLPEMQDWSAGMESEMCEPDLVDIFRESRQPRALPPTYRDEFKVAPEPVSRTIELVEDSAQWDIWRSPEEARLYETSKGKPPAYIEVEIDAEMMATGADSSSLRRLPTAKEFQLKGSAQNTPYRPGGFDGPVNIAPVFSAAEAARSLECLNTCLGLDGPLLTVPPGWDPHATARFNSSDGADTEAAAVAAAEAREGRHEKLSSSSGSSDGGSREAAVPEPEPQPSQEEEDEVEDVEEEEKRMDPSDGNMYSLGEFYQAYGPDNGLANWEACERRIDTEDGNPYAFHDFLAAYGPDGGKAKWEVAPHEHQKKKEKKKKAEKMSNVAEAKGTEAQSLLPERRIDKEDGNPYTYKDFVDAYGPEHGAERWAAAAPQDAKAQQQQRDAASVQQVQRKQPAVVLSNAKQSQPQQKAAPKAAPVQEVAEKLDLAAVFRDDDFGNSDGVGADWSSDDEPEVSRPTVAKASAAVAAMESAPGAGADSGQQSQKEGEGEPGVVDGVDAADEADLEDVLQQLAAFGKREGEKKAQAERKVWATEGGADMSNFRELVPEMAIEYPFELDNFQKEAIVHLERNENVFVAAHTSAGKTVVAEYGIAMAFQHMTKAIYTSPIKTLSNQKYREFCETFGVDEVGIVTGDVSINPAANVVIMTTEILRSMLYKGSDLIRDVEWVIFDEVHYLNDEERGVVWEEVIIMLPDHVSMIMLSATVPNTMEVANWVGRTKQKPVHVVMTLKRPVPLEHYILAKGKMFKLMDAKGVFLSNELKLAKKDDKKEREKELAKQGVRGGGNGRGRGGGRGGGASGGRSGKSYTQRGGGNNSRRGGRPPGPAGRTDPPFWKSVVDYLNSKSVLPVVIFTFGKHKCEECGQGLSSTDLTTKAEKAEIERFFNTAIRRLIPSDRDIPQITRTKELLKRGIGVHHAGLLPIIKEVVEMLFGQTLIKVLFATETFAMGVNMPTRTVIFNGIRKNDGKGFRELLPGEYTQMSGRAGRRGLDSVGLVFLSVGDGEAIPDEMVIKTMLKGRSTHLSSQFRLTYNMILNLLRVEDLKVEDMMKRSFSEFETQKDSGEVERLLKEGKARLHKQQEQYQNFLAASPLELSLQSDVDTFYRHSRRLQELNASITDSIANKSPDKLMTGRVVVCRSRAFGLAVGVVLYDGGRAGAAAAAKAKTAAAARGGPKLSLNALMNKPKQGSGGAGGTTDASSRAAQVLLIQPPDSCVARAGHAGEATGEVKRRQQRICGHLCELVELRPADLVSVCQTTLAIDKKALGVAAGADEPTLEMAVQQLLAVVEDAGPGELPRSLTTNELKINDMDFVEAYTARNSLLREAERVGARCTRSPGFAVHYRHVHRISTLQRGMSTLKHACSDQSLYLMPEFQKRLAVLQHLKYIDEQETVLLKGRVACEVTSSEALLVTELIFQNVLSDLSPEECVSLLSCLVFQEKVKYEMTLTPTLERARRRLMDIATDLARLQVNLGMRDIEPREYVAELVHDGMMEACYEWARGVPFVSITRLTDVFEGSIVRCISRLDELCRMCKNGARIAGSLGDTQLYAKMEQCSQMIKRDIVFAASLYVN